MRLFQVIFLGFPAAVEARGDCDFGDSCFINEGFSNEELDESGLTVICRGGCIFGSGALPVFIPSNLAIGSTCSRGDVISNTKNKDDGGGQMNEFSSEEVQEGSSAACDFLFGQIGIDVGGKRA